MGSRRAFVFAVVAVMLAVGGAYAAPAPTADAEPAATKRCKKGTKSAVIAGKRTCLKVGQRCKTRLDRQYHRYKLHCVAGRLARSHPVRAATPIGVQFHCMWGHYYTASAREEVLAKMAAAGIKWVRIDFGWNAAEPAQGTYNEGYVAGLEDCVSRSRAHGLNVLVAVMSTPDWASGGAGPGAPPTQASYFESFMRYLSGRFRGRVAAWQHGNEPNNGSFWTGTTQQFVDTMIKAGYRGVKSMQGDLGARVVTGGVMYNDADWVRSMYAAGAKDHFDVLGIHPYQDPGDLPPEEPPNGTRHRFRNMPAVRQAMVDNGDADAQIWVTEFGYSDHPNDGAWESVVVEHKYARGVTRQTQAAWAVRAIKYARANWPYVRLFTWYKERSFPLGHYSPSWFDEHVQGQGLLDSDLAPRPVYTAVRSYLTGR